MTLLLESRRAPCSAPSNNTHVSQEWPGNQLFKWEPLSVKRRAEKHVQTCFVLARGGPCAYLSYSLKRQCWIAQMNCSLWLLFCAHLWVKCDGIAAYAWSKCLHSLFRIPDMQPPVLFHHSKFVKKCKDEGFRQSLLVEWSENWEVKWVPCIFYHTSKQMWVDEYISLSKSVHSSYLGHCPILSNPMKCMFLDRGWDYSNVAHQRQP